MVRLTISFTAPNRSAEDLPDALGRSAEDLLDALRYLTATTYLEDGCLGSSVWTDPDSSVHYVEEWATEDSMRLRVRSDQFTYVLSVIESAPEAPRVQFDFVARTRGLDYVAEMRQPDVG
jgi:quinol monooxygenase YgiN